MRIGNLLKSAVIIAGLGALLWLGISKFDNAANDNASSTLDHRSAVESSITDQ